MIAADSKALIHDGVERICSGKATLGDQPDFVHDTLRHGVRRQGVWDQERSNLRESLAHLVGLI
ncbi:hypothetical protein, partial [uncultured Litoreibacter sp.]|uniref:hypothetical protein n=1 Tax=uncultured Litoreibacter sp. TaxID=1392394 RepID=UPI00261D162E